MRIARIFIYTIFFAYPAFASGGGFGGFTVSGSSINVSDLNSAFQNSKYPELSRNLFMLGGGGFALVNHLLIGGEGFGGSSTVESESVKTSYSVGGGFFNLGYVLPVLKAVNIYPIVGVGGVGHSLSFRPRLFDVTFSDLLRNPSRVSSISAGSFALNFSLAIHIVEPFKGAPFVGFFLRGGYIYSLNKADWKLEDGGEILGGPEANLSFPFATFGIIFGGRSHD